jgi:hypothetical protein
MRVVKEAIYASILGAGVCLASCGRNNNQNEGTADQSGNNTTEQVNETEMDSLVSPDTVMPAP